MASDEYDRERRRRRRRRHGNGRDLERRPEISIRALLVIVAGLAGAVLIGGGWYYYRSMTSPEARAFAEARRLPLVGMVIADQPGAEDRLKAAIDEDIRRPNHDGPSRESALVSELRSAYIAPTLRRADDASLIAAMAARAMLIEHLNKTDTKVCREFSLGGIQLPAKLDLEGQSLFKNVLTATEAAYRSGRVAAQPPSVPTLQEVRDMLGEAGFVKSDFDKLNSFATLSDDVTCYIALKLNQAAAKLKPEQRGPYSRFILGN